MSAAAWIVVGLLAGPAAGTFSTWMLDTQRLGAAKRARLAWLNVVLPLLAGFLAVALGHWLASL